jgi:hypothetical protein
VRNPFSRSREIKQAPFAVLLALCALLWARPARVSAAEKPPAKPAGKPKDSVSEKRFADPKLTDADLLQIQELVFKPLCASFVAGDAEALLKILAASGDEETIRRAAAREFRQTRYLDFQITDALPDDSFAGNRHTLDAVLRYKLIHIDEDIPGQPGEARSGRRVMDLWTETEPDGGGYWLSIEFSAPEAGRYDVLLRGSDLTRGAQAPFSSFVWSIDKGGEQAVTSGVDGLPIERRQDSGCLLGSVQLSEGSHLFHLRLTARATSRHHALWIDSLVLRACPPEPVKGEAPKEPAPPRHVICEAESGKCSPGWMRRGLIENSLSQLFILEKQPGGQFKLADVAFFHNLGMPRGIGGMIVNGLLLVMGLLAFVAFWTWMGYEAYRARPRLPFWRKFVLLPLLGAVVFFAGVYIPRLFRRAPASNQ